MLSRATGDIATFPEHGTGRMLRIEHWNVSLLSPSLLRVS